MWLASPIPNRLKRVILTIAGVAVLGGLYLVSTVNYLLFHAMAETFSVVVACGIFMVAWNSRQFLDNGYFPILGIAFAYVAGIDFLHTLSYGGMGVFNETGGNLSIQLWIAARYVQSASFVIATFFLQRTIRPAIIFALYSAVFAFLTGVIFFTPWFPVCYVPGEGLTRFKVISEYIICGFFLTAAGLLYRHRSRFDATVFRLLWISLVVLVGSELAFTLYQDIYGFSNLVGHLLKVVAFFLIYKALIEVGLAKPFNLLFLNLKKSESAHRRARNQAQRYLDVAGAIILALNPKGRVTLINRKGCATLEAPENEIMESGWFDTFIPPDEREEAKAGFRRTMSGEPLSQEYVEGRIVTRSGQERIIGWHQTILHDSQNHVLGLLASGEDITERKRAEAELSRSRAFLERTNRRLSQSLQKLQEDERAARSLQFHLMPRNKTLHRYYTFNTFIKTSAYLSGDFVDFFIIDEAHVGFYIADVSGHGVSSAFITVLLKSTMNHWLQDYHTGGGETILHPGRMLQHLNEYLVNQHFEKYLTMFYGVLDTQTDRLHYTNAGHFPPPLLRNHQQVHELTQKNLPVGLFPGTQYTTGSLKLPAHFVLAMFSDGVFEVLSGPDLESKQTSIKQWVRDLDLRMNLEALVSRLHLRTMASPIDDVTILLLKKEA